MSGKCGGRISRDDDFWRAELVKLNDQPRGVRLEYRVQAANPAGMSMPGNVAAVVL